MGCGSEGSDGLFLTALTTVTGRTGSNQIILQMHFVRISLHLDAIRATVMSRVTKKECKLPSKSDATDCNGASESQDVQIRGKFPLRSNEL